jgi:hypothetical protein
MLSAKGALRATPIQVRTEAKGFNMPRARAALQIVATAMMDAPPATSGPSIADPIRIGINGMPTPNV